MKLQKIERVPQNESESTEEFGKNIHTVIEFSRHEEPGKNPDGTSADFLTEAGKEKSVQKGPQIKEKNVKDYSSPKLRAQETGDLGLHNTEEDVKVINQRMDKITQPGGWLKQTFRKILDKELFQKYFGQDKTLKDVIVGQKAENEYVMRIRKELDAVPNFGKIMPEAKAFAEHQVKVGGTSSQMDYIIQYYLDHPERSAELGITTPQEAAEETAYRAVKEMEMTKHFTNNTDLRIRNFTHGPKLEPLLKEIMINNNGERGFKNLEEIGGSFNPGESFSFGTNRNEKGELSSKILFRGKEYDVDTERLKELAQGYKERIRLNTEIMGKAGDRDLPEFTNLMQESLAKIRKGKLRGEGRISKASDISDIITKRREDVEWRAVQEGKVKAQTIENDAIIFDTSDIHGGADDLKKVVQKYLDFSRHNPDKKVYFNFTGDIGGGKDQMACQEILASLQKEFPDRVNRTAGNADVRGGSLMIGSAQQLTERFAPEIHKKLQGRVEKIMARLSKEVKETGSIKEENLKAASGIIYAGQFLKAARKAGYPPVSPDEINAPFLYQIAKGMLKLKGDSQVLTMNVLRPLREMFEPDSKIQGRMEDKVLSKKHDKKMKEVFESWRTYNQLMSEQPTQLIMQDKQNDVVIATHTGVVPDITKLGDMVNDPEYAAQTAWNKVIYDEKDRGRIERFGNFKSITPQDVEEYVAKVVPEDKNVLIMAGHNHDSRTDVLKNCVRVEVCSGRGKAAQSGNKPEYAIVDMAKFHTHPREPEKFITRVEIPEK